MATFVLHYSDWTAGWGVLREVKGSGRTDFGRPSPIFSPVSARDRVVAGRRNIEVARPAVEPIEGRFVEMGSCSQSAGFNLKSTRLDCPPPWSRDEGADRYRELQQPWD